MSAGIRLGISACLLGEQVRYDGGHKREGFLADTLGKEVELVPVCPEKECGLGVPREPMQLVGDPRRPLLVTVHTGQDHTEQLWNWLQTRLLELDQEKLCGFIFKSGSPSCGLEGVKIYHPSGSLAGTGAGLFARAWRERFPELPVTDEIRFHDLACRENFLKAIFTLPQ